MNFEHDYYYDWIIKKNSKLNIPIPPKIKLDDEPKKPPLKKETYNDKPRGASVDAPIIRRDTYNSLNRLSGVSNSYNNTKYGIINPINGMTSNEFNAKSSRKDNAVNMMTTTGMLSTNEAGKLNKYDRMGISALNFNNDRVFRQTGSNNAYANPFGAPVLKKNYTSDNFNHGSKPYPLNRGSSQQLTTGRAQGKSIFHQNFP